MKILFSIFAVLVMVTAADRGKRCPGGCLGSMLAQGCVVTGDKLYVNGVYLKNLTSTEIAELSDYKKAIQDYKNQLEQAYEEDWLSRSELPEPPKTPSFCNSNMTTQYLFDGCVVQNNKVYVGGVYARDLTSSEITELEEYAKAVTEYEEYVTNVMEQRVQAMREVFDNFGRYRLSRQRATDMPTSTTTTAAPIKIPAPPDFCISFS